MKHSIFSLIFWLTTLTCTGQDIIKKNSLTFNFGPAYMMRQDLIFSPFTHSDLSFFNIGIEYARETKLFQKVIFRYSNFNPMVSSPYGFTVQGETETAYPHSFNIINLDYLIGKKITENEKSIFTVGGLFSTDIHSMNYVYGRISSFGYYSAFGLGIFGKWGVTVNEKNNISATLQLPLAAWLARPPYMGIDDEFIENISSHSGFQTFKSFVSDGELVTWNKLQTLDVGINYTRRLNEKWDFGAGYLFEFIHSKLPQNLLSFRNSINISATIRF